MHFMVLHIVQCTGRNETHTHRDFLTYSWFWKNEKKKKKRCKIVREGNGRDKREGKRETQGRNVTAELWFSSEDTHGAATLKEPLYSPLMTNKDEMLMQLKTAVLREKYVPLPLWIPPQIPHGLPWDWTQVSSQKVMTDNLHQDAAYKTHKEKREGKKKIWHWKVRVSFFAIYIYSNEIHNVVALIKCLLVLRCQLYMFWTITVHPQELLFRYCMCRLWYVPIRPAGTTF